MGSYFLVEGKRQLYGDFYPQGNKNEALCILAASLLTHRVRIFNVPLILDISNMLDILKSIGVSIKSIGSHAFELITENIHIENIHIESIQKIRGSLMLIAPLIHHMKNFSFPETGGDNIGIRSIYTHLYAFESFNISVTIEKKDKTKYYIFKSPKELKGKEILLQETSVTGTANIIMLAIFAKGETSILNAASEPHIQQLCRFLNHLGANIQGIGTNCLFIKGIDSLSTSLYEHHIHPDYLEIGSIISLAAVTSSHIRIKNVIRSDLLMILHIFKKFGIEPIFIENDLLIEGFQKMKIRENFLDYSNSILKIDDGPWPNFPADMISIIIVTATQCSGSALIFEKMFESRLFFVDHLIKMGAEITLCDPHRVVITGKKNLYSKDLTSPDIRAGIALLIAALAAEGKCKIDHIEQIDRGYETIENRLNKINANIQRIIEK